ncbi:NADP-dependent malic enzyme [Patescibacteria group bacterium]|nr:NADP-dependent malic enzyme [Patescibacteria group bacterium]MCL5797762.1 NADP-dependent malic enzyme [Patescibacteria group bacterium]
MKKNKYNEPLQLHRKLRGKLLVKSKIRIKTRSILSKVYTPGVAQAVKRIAQNSTDLFDLTIKSNTVAVISDGSAVLGLGNVGAEAALPVMEGKCAIFREFAGINAFPICLNTQNSNEIVDTIKNISPVFGAINLEDISAPRCFEIEEKLKILNIPVMHDDQHATAIVVLAGLINSAKIVNKDLKSCKIVINGVGAAGCAIAKLLNFYGIYNLILVDSRGIINKKRNDLLPYKKDLLNISNPNNIDGDLLKAAKSSDILIGVSQKDLFTSNIIKSMALNSIVFALANPDPEVSRKNAQKWGISIYANGRSDCRNQINNALVFPGFFKGLLKSKSRKVTNMMKVAAAQTLASLIPHPTANRFIPSIFDKRVVPVLEKSVIQSSI